MPAMLRRTTQSLVQGPRHAGARAAASIVLAASLAAGLAGCGFMTPQENERSYSPSDGVNASAGSVDIRDAFLVSLDGVNASLIVTLINQSAKPLAVTMQYDTTEGVTSQVVDVPASGLISIRPGQQTEVTMRNLSAPVGSLFPISFASGTGTGTGTTGKFTQVPVPVLDNSLPGYATLTPPPSPIPTPTPTKTKKPSATASPSPTDSATPDTTPTP